MAGEKKKEEGQAKLKEIEDPSTSTAAAKFKLNPNAPEFVPNSFIQMPIPGYFCRYHELLSFGPGRMGSDCFKFEDQKPMDFVPDSNTMAPNLNENNADLIQKIVKQSRTVIVENLREDSSRQNIEKIFSIIGSVKNIRICHLPEPNSTKPLKTDVLISNKLHAFVEFETTDQADKAVEKLNDESDWRKGLRVRPRSVIRSKRSDCDHFDVNLDDDQPPISQNIEPPKIEQVLQQNVGEKQKVAIKPWGRGRGKHIGLVQNLNSRRVLSKTPPGAQKIGHGVCENHIKQTSSGPRIPDGTRGFTMGRGKPLKSLMSTTDPATIKL